MPGIALRRGLGGRITLSRPAVGGAWGEIPVGSLDRAIAAIRSASTQRVEWVAFGDSTFAGQTLTAPEYSPLTRLRELLTAAGVPDGGHGTVNGALDTPHVSGEPSDAGQVANTGFNSAGSASFSMHGETLISNAGGDQETLTVYGRHLRLYYVAFTLGGRFSYQVDGGAEITVDPAYPASGFTRWARIAIDTGTDGRHTIVIRNKGGRPVGVPTISAGSSAAGTGATLPAGSYEYAAAFKTSDGKVGALGSSITRTVTAGQSVNVIFPGQAPAAGSTAGMGANTNVYRRVAGSGATFKLIGTVATNGNGQYNLQDTGIADGADYAASAAPVLEPQYAFVNVVGDCVRATGLVMHNLAVRGTQSSALTDQALAYGLGYDLTVDPSTSVLTRAKDTSPDARHPALVTFAHGINDQQGNGGTDTSAATYANTVRGIKAARKAGADVLIFVPGLEAANQPQLAPNYRAAIVKAARDQRAPWIDIGVLGALGPFTGWAAAGYGGQSANPHLTELAYRTQGEFIFAKALGPRLPPLAPANTAVPAISGTAKTGFTVTSSTGTFKGFPTPTYTYQWKRNGTPISGAIAAAYVLQAADVGQPITCTVTATNAAGTASATSASVTPSAPFSPSSLSGLQAWYDAGQISGVTTDGAAVASWTDLSGNGRHATQATAGMQPVLKTGANGIGGAPVVRFDGTDDWLKTASFALAQPLTAVLIYKPRAHPSSTRQVLAEGAGFDRIFAHTSGGNPSMTFGTALGGTQFLTLGTPRIVRCIANGASSSMVFDNGKGTTSAAGNVGAGAIAGGLQIGGENGSGFAPSCDVAEVILYNRVLTAPELANLEGYLSEKYGIAIT